MVDRNFSWSAAARELGRTSQQCASCYSTGIYRSFGLLFDREGEEGKRRRREGRQQEELQEGSTREDDDEVSFDVRKHFKSGIRSRTWDSEEDISLLQHYATYGNKWKQIGSILHRRGSQVLPQICLFHLK